MILERGGMEELDPVFVRLAECGVAAVVTIEDAAQAVLLAKALLAGGISAMELTLRTEAALDGLERIVKEVPGMQVGGGTVLTPGQVADVHRAGASFAVAPGTNLTVIEAARGLGLPFAPGIATPSDIEAAVGHGCRVLKFFPADGMGGLRYLHNIAAPYRHLGLRYIPLGGISETNLADYLASPDVLAVGGSWLAPPRLIEADDWDGVEALAARAAAQVAAARRDADRS